MKTALRVLAAAWAVVGITAASSGAHPAWALLAGVCAGGAWAASARIAGGRT